MTAEWFRSALREAKVPGVALFVLATVYVCAWSRRLEREAESIHLWPPLQFAQQPGPTTPSGQEPIEVTSLSGGSD
jgi:hypothetical protein